ncbi:MAG: uroporphyrinogen decarboxylase family protein [Phycisphaeraceae bacterium]|nr:uroporphyrinogen decarboxylase family protein [Phycisphaeraceae bacterium]
MTGCQRIMAAMEGRWPDRVPVMLHDFMMAARQSGVTMAQFRSDPAVMSRCFIEAVERHGHDGMLVDMDTATVAGAMGAPVTFPDDSPAVVHGAMLTELAQVNDLQPPDISSYPGVQAWTEAVRLIKQHFGDAVAVRGNCDQLPFSLASMLRGTENWMLDLADPDSEELVHRLLAHCTQGANEFVRLMAQTGCDMLSHGDSPCGPEMISSAMYRRFSMPYEKRVIDLVHELGFMHVLHICGRTDSIIADMLDTGTDALELDYKTDAQRAHDLMADRATFIGNLDPSGVLARGTPELVTQKAEALLDIFADTPRFIMNAGCAIPPTTPSENLRAMVDAAHARVHQ